MGFVHPTWENLGTFKSEYFNNVSFSPDGRYRVASLFVGNRGRRAIHIWQAPFPWSEVERLPPVRILRPDGSICRIVFSPDGKLLAAATDDGVEIWRTEDWRPVAPLAMKSASGRIALSPNNRWLAFDNREGRIFVWDTRGASLVAELPGHPRTRFIFHSPPSRKNPRRKAQEFWRRIGSLPYFSRRASAQSA